jgi:hypothetical protein
MAFIQTDISGARVAREDGTPGHYEWPHAGSVLEVDQHTAGPLLRVSGFRELPPDHPDVLSEHGRHEVGVGTPAGDDEAATGKQGATTATSGAKAPAAKAATKS